MNCFLVAGILGLSFCLRVGATDLTSGLKAGTGSANASTLSDEFAEQLTDEACVGMHSKLPLSKPSARVADVQGKGASVAKATRSDAVPAGVQKQGIELGMSRERVMRSSWGKPERIYRMRRVLSGEQEQWVYKQGYLYFDQGVLTSIRCQSATLVPRPPG